MQIKYNSWLAKLLPKRFVAITIWRTIHIRGFTASPALLSHEKQHVIQWEENGFFKFAVLYLWYSIRYGYYNNPFEVEARKAEYNAS